MGSAAAGHASIREGSRLNATTVPALTRMARNVEIKARIGSVEALAAKAATIASEAPTAPTGSTSR